MASFENLIGRKFNRLTVIEQAEMVVYSNGRKRTAWKCLCECGNSKVITSQALKNGSIRSCGCLKAENNKKKWTKHGHCGERLYRVWCDIKKRCYNPKFHQYKDYGGRGIRVCDEWVENYSSFREFALANGYNEFAKRGDCTIDRIDVDGNYEPSNCRFVSMKVQNSNKRRNKNVCI